jgi:RNA polymerase sigma factor (sigma-70 family)
MERHGPAGLDPLLLPFLTAEDADERDRAAARLLAEHAGPIVSRVLRRRLRVPVEGDPDAEDVRSEVMVQLAGRLEALRSRPDERPIANLAGYVAVMAYHACDHYVRRKRPARWRLKNRLRYALTHKVALALWEEEGEWQAGLAQWREKPPMGVPGRLETLRSRPRAAAAAALAPRDTLEVTTGEVLYRLLRWLGQPLPLDELVEAMAVIWDVGEGVVVEATEIPDASPAMETLLDQRRCLERLWREVQELPPRQRVALLLNLRDDHGADLLGLLMLTGIARLHEVATVIGMDAGELARLWKDLPLEDAVLAQRLGLTRQQVINLRKCARERLARRLRAAGLGLGDVDSRPGER